MGKNKKVTGQAESSKASKNNNIHEKKDLNRLIKVLRPKVYITDSASFKMLVQELTGNGSSSSPIASQSTIPMKPQERRIKEALVIDVEEEYLGDPESSFESSIEAEPYSCEFLNQLCLDQEFNQMCKEIGLEDMNSGSSQANQLDTDLFAYCDIDSSLLDTTNPYTFCGGFDQFQDVSIYDYELFGLL